MSISMETQARKIEKKRFLKRCGDCGQFVRRDLWLDKEKHPKAVHALCAGCKDNYDDCRDH